MVMMQHLQSPSSQEVLEITTLSQMVTMQVQMSSNAGLQFGRRSIGGISTRNRKANTTQVSQVRSAQHAVDTSC